MTFKDLNLQDFFGKKYIKNTVPKKGIFGNPFQQVFFFLLFLFLITNLTAQTREQKETYKNFDQIIGRENSGLLDGYEYVERHRIINEKHKFFNQYEFVPGTVFYDGQAFFNVDIKYNVFEDILLIQFENERGKNVFQAFSRKLDGFILNNREFINLKKDETNPSLAGIYEVLFENDFFRALKKHRKKEKTLLDKEVVYHEFSQDEPEYVYSIGGELKKLSRSNLTESFPEEKSVIKDFYRRNRKLSKTNPDLFVERLFTELALKSSHE